VNLERTGERRDLLVPLLVLGPGTLLVIALGTVAVARWMHFPPVMAGMAAAVLASTDPAVLRDVTRDPAVPSPIRRVLSIESGLNDLVVLPILLVLLASAQQRVGTTSGWLWFLAELLVLGPLAGFAIGGLGAWLMATVDARWPVRREFQSIYGIGIVLLAYGAGAAIGVDGFLAAFAAGLGITLLNQRLCDCFLEYGAATAEMAMLLAFAAFGALLSTVLGGRLLWPSLALAAFLLFVARPLAIALITIRPSGLSWQARALIAWFGPRGLSSLLFALLVVRAGVPEATSVLAVVGAVVVASVVLHGASATPVSALYARALARRTLGEERESTAAGLFAGDGSEVPRVTADGLAAELERPDPPLVLDVRSRSQHALDPRRIRGALRVLPDEVERWAQGRPLPGRVVTYCT
jgi:NhaP-type Na+/H+ or K+/H+ antiporter